MSAAAERLLRRLPLNPQFRDELRRFLDNGAARVLALWLVGCVGVVLLLAWPVYPVLDLAQGPFTYKAVGTVTVLVAAYLAFVHGIRAQAGGGRFSVQEWAAFVPLAPGAYVRGAAAGRMLELLFFVALAFPLLMPAAALEGAAAPQYLALGLILAMTALTGRLVALAGLLWLEHRPSLLIVLTHAAMAGMFLGGLAWPPLSPLAAFYASLGGITGGGWGESLAAPWPGFVLTHGLAAAAAFTLAWWRVGGLRRRAGLASSAAGR